MILDRIDNVDLREALGDIAKTNTFFHRENDLGISIEQMERAAKINDYADKTLIWVSHPTGIGCYSEREAFQKDTRAYNGVLFHGFDMQSDRKLAYAVDVAGMTNGRPHGSLYEIDIREYAEEVRKNAVASNTVRIYIDDPYGNGEQKFMPKDEFYRRYPLDLVKIAYWRHEPDDQVSLKNIIEDIWNNARDGKHQKCDLWQHIDKLYDNRTDFYSNQIIENMNKLHEPNSADRQFFHAPLNSYVVAAYNSEQLALLLDSLPYKGAEFSIKKGQTGMGVFVPRDEVLQLRREQAEKADKPSVLDALEKNEQKSRQQFGQKAAHDKDVAKKPRGEEI
jgi:hypothetical protein